MTPQEHACYTIEVRTDRTKDGQNTRPILSKPVAQQQKLLNPPVLDVALGNHRKMQDNAHRNAPVYATKGTIRLSRAASIGYDRHALERS